MMIPVVLFEDLLFDLLPQLIFVCFIIAREKVSENYSNWTLFTSILSYYHSLVFSRVSRFEKKLVRTNLFSKHSMNSK